MWDSLCLVPMKGQNEMRAHAITIIKDPEPKSTE